MKKYLVLLLAMPFFAACNSDDYNYKNPYLPNNYTFSIDLDLNLPSFSPLQFTGNAVFINGYGINGIFVMNTGGAFTAFEATCPNQNISSCSDMELNGINAVCPCDDVEYSLFTGQPDADLKYSLMPYRIEILGPTLIRVYN